MARIAILWRGRGMFTINYRDDDEYGISLKENDRYAWSIVDHGLHG